MTPSRPTRRRGAAAVVALACLTIAVSLGATLLTASLRQRLQGRVEHAARQADELVAAGLARATFALREDAAYDGETWIPTPPQALAEAEMRVEITVDREAKRLRVAATYQPPVGQSVRRSQDFPLPLKPGVGDG